MQKGLCPSLPKRALPQLLKRLGLQIYDKAAMLPVVCWLGGLNHSPHGVLVGTGGE